VSKIIRLDITPQTHVRATQGDRLFFRIPRDKLRPAGLKRLLRLERYNQYKVDLRAEAKRKQFVVPPQGMSVHFFIPAPASWSGKKKKLYHGAFNQSTPDLDNYLKALIDSLVDEDKYICHYGELSKRWVDFPVGWIEIHLSEPSQVLIPPPPKG
jgi:Holliday junction resolvase RusA-like endonuclease